MFDDEMIEEFKVEAFELLEEAERDLLALDRGDDFEQNYNSCFRVFHSLKGGAGMLGMEALQAHTHFLENLLEKRKAEQSFPKVYIDYFLAGIDAARSLLNGEAVDFQLYDPGEGQEQSVSGTKNEAEVKVEIQHEEALEENLVYVVDDEPYIVELLSEIVTDNGLNAKGFENGLKAFEEIKKAKGKNKPKCILLDLTMPEMSGMEFLKEVQQIDPFLPVIFISGNLEKNDVIKAIEYGVYAVLEKPFNPNQVRTLLTNAVLKYETMNLLDRSIKFMFYQFSDLDKFLEQAGKEDVRQAMSQELKQLLDHRKKLKGVSKKKA